MEHGNAFIPLLIVLGLAFLVPLLINRFKALPVVVGEILAGLVLAQVGILKPDSSATLTLFSNIGLAFLMFLAGLEIDISSLFARSSVPAEKKALPLPLLALIVYLLTLGLSAVGSSLLQGWGMPGNRELLTLVLGATSLGVVLPVLKNRGIMHTRGGQAIFLTATIADFLTVILLTIYTLVNQHGLSPEILSLLLIFLVFIGAARIGARFIRLPAVQTVFDELSQATVQIKVRGAIVILLVFVVLAESLGIELILGAFLAGMLVALFKTPQDDEAGLVHKLEAFGFGMFIPIFFIVTGANLNISALAENPQSLAFLPALLGISILVKLLSALVFRTIMGWRSTLAAGLLLNTHLSLEVAIAVIGEQVGLLTPATSAAIIVFAVLTVVFMPLLFSLIQPLPPKGPERQLRLIFGWENSLARSVAQHLLRHGDRVCMVVNLPAQEEEAHRNGMETVEATALQLRPEEVETVLALSTQDDENLRISEMALAAQIGHIIALVNEPAHLEPFKRLGVQVFSPVMFRATLISLMARNPNTFGMLTSTEDERDLLELALRNPKLAGRRLRELALPGDALILSIKRDGEMLIPHGNTRLEHDDEVSILVNNAYASGLIQLFAQQYPLAGE